MYIPDSYLEQLIADDVPSIDLTTHVLGIGDEPGQMEYFTRDDAVLVGTEEAARIFGMLGGRVVDYAPTGTRLAAGDSFMHVEGPAAALHMGWKCCLNIFEYYSALATKARRMVDEAHASNPHCEVLTTRKSMPGTKLLGTKAVMAGGAFPHRLGLSETALVFDHHLTFYKQGSVDGGIVAETADCEGALGVANGEGAGGAEDHADGVCALSGVDAFIADLPQIKAHLCEKKLFVEATAQSAVRLARAGVDGVQLDKMPVDELAELVRELRSIDERLTIIAAGGVNVENARAYAATGVDGLATTCLHFAKPLDMSVRMRRAQL